MAQALPSGQAFDKTTHLSCGQCQGGVPCTFYLDTLLRPFAVEVSRSLAASSGRCCALGWRYSLGRPAKESLAGGSEAGQAAAAGRGKLLCVAAAARVQSTTVPDPADITNPVKTSVFLRNPRTGQRRKQDPTLVQSACVVGWLFGSCAHAAPPRPLAHARRGCVRGQMHGCATPAAALSHLTPTCSLPTRQLVAGPPAPAAPQTRTLLRWWGPQWRCATPCRPAARWSSLPRR